MKLLGYESFYIATTMIAVVIWGLSLVHCGKKDNGKIKKIPLVLCITGIVLMFSSIYLELTGTFSPYHERCLESVEFASVSYNKNGDIVSENHEQGLYFSVIQDNELVEYFVQKGDYDIVLIDDSEDLKVKYKKYREQESDKIFGATFYIPKKAENIISGESVLEIPYGYYNITETKAPEQYKKQEIEKK